MDERRFIGSTLRSNMAAMTLRSMLEALPAVEIKDGITGSHINRLPRSKKDRQKLKGKKP
ncbi:MAG: hypothetical protein KG075_21885 [Alphaproteobacteria bacterium]|nr:hypothetical protein [Alphaproteobacteria bacterium]